MSFLCAISGDVPKEPVVSPKTGKLYERRLIVKYIDENGKEPGTEEPLSESDLITLSQDSPVVAPRPPTITSIPSILSVLQNEWDALVLESYTLKQQYQQVRQELTQALYQHDAACRVIARLMKERDEARKALADIQAHLSLQPSATAAGAAENGKAESAMEVEAKGDGASAEEAMLGKITATAEELSKARKKRKLPENFTPAETVRAFAQTTTVESLHSSTSPGILDIMSDVSGNYILTAGMDKHAEIYNITEDKTMCVLKGHTKKVNAVAWRGGAESGLEDICFTVSADKSARIWVPDGNGIWKKEAILKPHSNEVTSISVHPCRDYFASSSLDGTWALHDVATAVTYFTAQSEGTTSITAASFHPDGLIYAAGGSDSSIYIWDVKQRKQLITFPAKNPNGPITSLSFSDKGYYVAAAHSSIVEVWDLRKHTTPFSADLCEPSAEQKSEPWNKDSVIKSVQFDRSGTYLAVGGEDVRIYQAKTWHELFRNDANTMEVTGITWTDPLAARFVTSSLDRTLRFFGAPQ